MSKKRIGLVVLIAMLGLAQASLAQWNPDTDASLVGWWKLDETSGATAVDSSVNGNDATVFGDAAWGVGRTNGALQLDGANDYVQSAIPVNVSNSEGVAELAEVLRVRGVQCEEERAVSPRESVYAPLGLVTSDILVVCAHNDVTPAIAVDVADCDRLPEAKPLLGIGRIEWEK